MIAQLIGVGASLLGGFVGKKLGGSKKVGGDTPWNKVLAPVFAVGMGIGYNAIGAGPEVSVEAIIGNGTATGVFASGTYSMLKSFGVFAKEKKAKSNGDRKYFIADKEITRGDDDSVVMTWKIDGTPTDVSTWSFWYMAKINKSDDDTLAVIVVDPGADITFSNANGTNDRVTIAISKAKTAVDPGVYHHEVQVNDGSGNKTRMKGMLTIAQDVIDKDS